MAKCYSSMNLTIGELNGKKKGGEEKILFVWNYIFIFTKDRILIIFFHQIVFLYKNYSCNRIYWSRSMSIFHRYFPKISARVRSFLTVWTGVERALLKTLPSRMSLFFVYQFDPRGGQGCPLNGEPTNLSRACSLSINKVPCGSDVRQFGRRLPFRFVWQKIILNRRCTCFLRALFSWQMIEMMRFNCSWQRSSSILIYRTPKIMECCW